MAAAPAAPAAGPPQATRCTHSPRSALPTPAGDAIAARSATRHPNSRRRSRERPDPSRDAADSLHPQRFTRQPRMRAISAGPLTGASPYQLIGSQRRGHERAARSPEVVGEPESGERRGIEANNVERSLLRVISRAAPAFLAHGVPARSAPTVIRGWRGVRLRCSPRAAPQSRQRSRAAVDGPGYLTIRMIRIMPSCVCSLPSWVFMRQATTQMPGCWVIVIC
jgi:hypothetical protein